MKTYTYLLAIPVLMLFACTRKYAPLATAESVEVERYAGQWYEIASIPNSFQKGCSCTTATYTMKGKYLEVRNKCYKADKKSWTDIKGKAFVVENSNNAKLKVQFFWPFRAPYWILERADDYSYAVVGTPDRDYLWILSRTKTMDETIYNELLAKVAAKGFDVQRLRKTAQDCQ
jgi:apolipoprotein D and lipocalin family protein